jgi:hypothetical protein
MPSEPRKLPVIYAKTKFLIPYSGSGIGIVPAYTRTPNALYSAEFTRYERSVPRCATCPSYVVDNGSQDRDLCVATRVLGNDSMPTTTAKGGIGYCWLHPEAPRG